MSAEHISAPAYVKHVPSACFQPDLGVPRVHIYKRVSSLFYYFQNTCKRLGI